MTPNQVKELKDIIQAIRAKAPKEYERLAEFVKLLYDERITNLVNSSDFSNIRYLQGQLFVLDKLKKVLTFLEI